MRSFLNMRMKLQKEGLRCLSAEKSAAYRARPDAVTVEGQEQDKKTRGSEARREERNLRNRLEKFRDITCCSCMIFRHLSVTIWARKI